MLVFGLIEISRLNVAKPCYLSKMSVEGKIDFFFTFLFAIFFFLFFFFFCQCEVAVSFSQVCVLLK